jgi:hypothetical protein
MKLLLFTILILWVLSCWLQSCSTTKSVTKTVTDSTSVKQVDSLTRVIKSLNAKSTEFTFTEGGTTIIFDTLYVPGDTTVITIEKDGSIKAKGRVKSLTSENSSISKKLTELQQSYDSLNNVKSESKVEVRTITKDREVKRTVFPWWYILILGGAVFLFLKLKKIYL